jgi:hypothetical protein
MGLAAGRHSAAATATVSRAETEGEETLLFVLLLLLLHKIQNWLTGTVARVLKM